MRDFERYVEPKITDLLFSKAARKKVPLSGTFELSPLCNFSCRMCYVRKTAEEVRNQGRPMVSAEKWLEIAEAAGREGMLYLLLTGGEPFLYPDFWKLYEALNRMGFVISINTNGSMIDEAVVERLRERPPMKINLTLYGAKDSTYESLCGVKGVFSRVDRAITMLREAGIAVKLNGALTPDNICDLKECVRYAQERGLIYEVNTYMFPPVRRDPSMAGVNRRFTPKEAARYNLESYRLLSGEELYWKRLEAIESGSIPPPGLDENCIDPTDGKVRCRAGKASFWITWDGWMTPCGMMPEPKVDVTRGTFAEQWKELTEVSGQLRVSGIRSKCPNQLLCHSCAAMAEAETGSTEKVPVYLCEMVNEMKKYAKFQLEQRKS